MSTGLTRRQLVGVAAGSAAVSLAVVSAIGQAPVTSRGWDKEARDSHKQNSAALAAFTIKMSVEPAFQFKA